MNGSFRAGLILLAGVSLLVAALAIHAILLEPATWTLVLAGAGLALAAWGGFALRRDIGAMLRRRRGEVAVFTAGVIVVLVAMAYLTARWSLRFDLTEAGLHSLSAQTVSMLERLEKPVHIVYFHDPLMRDTVELYELMASQSDLVTVEFHDPTLNPARARLLGVRFAGTALMESEGRKIQVHGRSETDLANGILRVSRAVKQRVCFLEGHREADPFSMESHDHMEGTASPDHAHGLGAQYVLHERHGLAKARHALETLNYEVAPIALSRADHGLSACALLVVAGPKLSLLPAEVTAVRGYLAAGGNGLFMLDPFVETGLEPVIREYGVVLDDAIVIDEASHYWTDVSAPAVTTYNRHQVTRDLPLTFFPGARSLSPTPNRVPGTNVIALINSSKSSYGETDPRRAEFDDRYDIAGPTTLMVVATRRPPTSADVLAGELGPQRDDARPGDADSAAEPSYRVSGRSRVVVIGDSDFATNSFFHFLGNGNLFLNAVNYLAAQENLIGIEPRTYDLPRLTFTNRQLKGTFALSMLLLPGLLAVIGTAVWWRQR